MFDIHNIVNVIRLQTLSCVSQAADKQQYEV
jgi:hypothetical protein